jgi:hypothetical protein
MCVCMQMTVELAAGYTMVGCSGTAAAAQTMNAAGTSRVVSLMLLLLLRTSGASSIGRPELAATVSAMPASATATNAVLQPCIASDSSWMISSCSRAGQVCREPEGCEMGLKHVQGVAQQHALQYETDRLGCSGMMRSLFCALSSRLASLLHAAVTQLLTQRCRRQPRAACGASQLTACCWSHLVLCELVGTHKLPFQELSRHDEGITIDAASGDVWA